MFLCPQGPARIEVPSDSVGVVPTADPVELGLGDTAAFQVFDEQPAASGPIAPAADRRKPRSTLDKLEDFPARQLRNRNGIASRHNIPK